VPATPPKSALGDLLNLAVGLVSFVPAVGPGLSGILTAANIFVGNNEGVPDSTQLSVAENRKAEVEVAYDKAKGAAASLVSGVSIHTHSQLAQ
jgi:hypothetical protein